MFNWSFRFLVESTPKLHFLGDFSLLLVFLIFHNHFYQWLELFANTLTVSVIDYLSLPCISGKPFLFHFISHCNGIFSSYWWISKQPVCQINHGEKLGYEILVSFSMDFLWTNQVKTHLVPRMDSTLIIPFQVSSSSRLLLFWILFVPSFWHSLQDFFQYDTMTIFGKS